MKWKALKHWFMVQIWRVQQVGSVLSLVLMGVGDAILVTNAVVWRIGNYYATVTAILLIIGAAVWIFGRTWDKGLKMWIEQSEVVVERNPYMKYHMTAKEIISNLTMWIPLYQFLKLEPAPQVMEDWCKKAITIDPKVKVLCDDLIREFKVEKFIREKYPWYGV